jgi:metal-responsive CopG/Arc/MetJ family transcriptional regulator
MQRFMMSVSDEMLQELEKERKLRRVDTVQEVARQIISDYLKARNGKQTPKRSDKLL